MMPPLMLVVADRFRFWLPLWCAEHIRDKPLQSEECNFNIGMERD